MAVIQPTPDHTLDKATIEKLKRVNTIVIVDVLARNTTWTFSRDTDLKFDFIGVNYYDGQGFMVPKALGVSSAVCGT